MVNLNAGFVEVVSNGATYSLLLLVVDRFDPA